jgi:acetylglutamate kinase
VKVRQARQTVLNSLAAIGANREAQFYASLFAQQEPERFALLVIDPRCLKNPLLEALIGNLKLLFDLGLSPVILVGAMDDDRTGVRFQSQRIAKELDQASVRVAKLNTASYALVPEVRSKAQSGRLPILEMTERRGKMNLVELVKELHPNKVIFLQPSGGLSQTGQRLRNLGTDSIPSLLEHGGSLSVGQERFLRMVLELEEAEPGARAYIIASPLNLLPELFTTKGSGTLIKRKALIRSAKTIKTFDETALRQSINTAFGKTLSPDFFKNRFKAIYVEENYKGGAIFSTENNLTYLSKFWVNKQAQGEGLSRNLWECFTQDISEFYWRSKLTNPFNDWYMRNCDGMQIMGDWRIFWKGLSPQDVSIAIDAATKAPEDFAPE